MDFLSLSLRLAASGRADYLPYGFDALEQFGIVWTDEERAAVEAAIKPHVPERVDSMFNNWLFSKYGADSFVARRSTWDMGSINTTSAAALADEITRYYTR